MTPLLFNLKAKKVLVVGGGSGYFSDELSPYWKTACKLIAVSRVTRRSKNREQSADPDQCRLSQEQLADIDLAVAATVIVS